MYKYVAYPSMWSGEVRAHIRTKWELLERLGVTVSIGGDTVQLIHPPVSLK